MSRAQEAVQREHEQEKVADRHNGQAQRAYAATWVIERMRPYLPTEHVELACWLTVMMGRAYDGYTLSGEIIGFINRACDPTKLDIKMWTRTDMMQELGGFERAAYTRAGKIGWQCYRAILEGCSQFDLARRVGLSAESNRSLRRLVQITLEELQAYHDENAIDLARWNGRAA